MKRDNWIAWIKDITKHKFFISQIRQTFKCSGTVFANLPWHRRPKDKVPLFDPKVLHFDPKVRLFENILLKIMAQLKCKSALWGANSINHCELQKGPRPEYAFLGTNTHLTFDHTFMNTKYIFISPIFIYIFIHSWIFSKINKLFIYCLGSCIFIAPNFFLKPIYFWKINKF